MSDKTVSVGDIVHYTDWDGSIAPAIVTFVGSKGLVNLQVLKLQTAGLEFRLSVKKGPKEKFNSWRMKE